MPATELPRPFHRPGWVYKKKYHGWRMVAEKVDNQVTLTSRNSFDHTRRFPELVKAIAAMDSPSLVLDGEIAIFDRQLISRFEWLRARPKDEVATPTDVHGLRSAGAGGRGLAAAVGDSDWNQILEPSGCLRGSACRKYKKRLEPGAGVEPATY